MSRKQVIGISVDADRVAGASEDEAQPPESSIMRLRFTAAGMINRSADWLLLAIILTLPLQVTKSLFPIQQIEVSRLLMGVAMAWMLTGIRARGWPLSRALTLSIGAIFVVLMLSLAGTRWADGVLLVLAPLFYVSFALFVASTVRDRSAVVMMATGVVASGVMVASVTIAVGAGGIYLWREGVLGVLGRANSTFADPNVAARFLILVLVTMLAVAAFPRRPDGRVYLAGVGILTLLAAAFLTLLAAALVLTESRFGWIMLIVVLPLLILAVRPRRIVAAYSGVFLIAFIAVALVNGTAVGRVGDVAAGVSHLIGGEVSSGDRGNLTGASSKEYLPPRKVLGHEIYSRLPIDDVRLYLLEAGVAMWEDHPLAGVGVGGFRPNLLGPYRGFIPRDRLESPTSLPHTFISQLAAENGLVGIIVVGVFVAVIAVMTYQASRSRDELLRSGSVVAGLSILVIFLSSQVAGGFLVEPYLWLAVGALAGIHRLVVKEAMVAQSG